MSYPAQNTDAEFQALVYEVNRLRGAVRALTSYNDKTINEYAENVIQYSTDRLERTFQRRDFDEMFDVLKENS
jgi:hypothetical protein